MITTNGTVPYPSWVDSRPMWEMGSALRSLARSIEDGVLVMKDVVTTSGQSWSGPAADQFAAHIDERSRMVALIAEVAQQAAPMLDSYAAAIERTQDMYCAAAEAESSARPYLPASLTVVEAAMAAEVAAVVSLSVAGTTFAAALSVFQMEAEFAGPLNDLANGFTFDDVKKSAVRLGNITNTTENADGTVRQQNLVGSLLDATFGPMLEVLQVGGGVVGLMNATPLTARELTTMPGDDKSTYIDLLKSRGFVAQPSNVRELGLNLALTEAFQRNAGVVSAGGEIDQSSVVPHTIGVAPDKTRVITLQIPGIVPPALQTGTIDGESGERNVIGGILSQTTGLGVVETSIRRQLETLGLKKGDRVVLLGHSYGGIIARNTANSLAREGHEVSFVSYGSPDGPLERGVEAYMVQNVNDFVPVGRVLGDGMVGARYGSHQQVITVRQQATGKFDNHAPQSYGDNLTQTPNLQLNDFLRRQGLVQVTRQGVVAFEGPQSPTGGPNSGREDFDLPKGSGK